MNKQDLIKELNKQIKNKRSEYWDMPYDHERAIIVSRVNGLHQAKKIVEKLDEPKKSISQEEAIWFEETAERLGVIIEELPVIPPVIAEYIESLKRGGLNFICGYARAEKCSESGRNNIQGWLKSEENLETFAIAWLYGYMIEKEKRYRVKLPDVESESYNNLLGLRRTGDDRIVICKIKLSTFLHSDNVCFTEQEIKRNHEYLWQFAEEVIDK